MYLAYIYADAPLLSIANYEYTIYIKIVTNVNVKFSDIRFGVIYSMQKNNKPFHMIDLST